MDHITMYKTVDNSTNSGTIIMYKKVDIYTNSETIPIGSETGIQPRKQRVDNFKN
jgi:hypothetical protein